MNIQVERDIFLPLLSQAQGVLEKRAIIPVLSNILIDADKDMVSLYAADSEISFLADFPAQVSQPGKIVVNGKRLFDIVREFSSGLILLKKQANNKIKIQKEQAVFQIHGLEDESFPRFPSIKSKTFQKIKSHNLIEAIDKTIYSTSLDEARYHLTGVYFESFDKGYRFVSTDGHRMSCLDIPLSNSFLSFKEGVIIPRKGLQEIKRMLLSDDGTQDVEIAVEKPRLIVKFKNQILSTRLIEGRYPDYKQLIPKDKGVEISINRLDFFHSLKRVSILASARFKGLILSFSKNKLSMEFSNPDIGEAKELVDCNFKGQDIKVKFNSKYILDVLNSTQDETIKIILKDKNSPGMIQAGKDKNYICIVMPMKLDDSSKS